MVSESVLADILVQKFVYQSDILSCPYIQVDESTIPVIDNEKSMTRKGYMWCVRDASGSGVFLHYDMGSRGTQVAMSLLKDYQGAIQSDGYDVYNKFTGMEGKTMLGCWAHARRKFEEWMQVKFFDPSMGPLMSTAIEYTFKRLANLSMYITNESWNIDNNGVENAI